MIRPHSHHQLSFEEFRTPFEINLSRENRWVKLAETLPWDHLEAVYHRTLSATMGRPAIAARIIIGSLIIKHVERLSDEDTIGSIQENVYQQYFLGLHQYQYEPVFNPSLFVSIRERLGEEEFDAMVKAFIHLAEGKRTSNDDSSDRGGSGGRTQEPLPPGSNVSSEEGGERTEQVEQSSLSENQAGEPKEPVNQGMLIADLTVAPADIAYPTDMDLLNTSREKSEALIDTMYTAIPGAMKITKPRTYRENARKEYLAFAKKKKKNAKTVRKAVRKQLGFLKRNIQTIHRLWDIVPASLSYSERKTFWVLQEVYRQQQEMYQTKAHRVEGRIVSLAQPHVRPIVRGKAKAPTEFGAQLSCSIMNGFTRLHRIVWDAYNEASDLPEQIEEYKATYGCYPKVVLADKKYGTRENRAYMSERNITYGGTPLGRPKNDGIRKTVTKAISNLRNLIEGIFGRGKRSYGLDRIHARRSDTSASWIAAIFFVMNIDVFIKFLFSFLSSLEMMVYTLWEEHSTSLYLRPRFRLL